ncbi:transcriptional regulator [Aurantiacibacter suaedae]|uniref:transcriptional regulator n=1 Tax=Aurantiacibacter suaedae TaxID=2545755 RepID=UPI0010F5A822|nr:helix-turn-helix domain-containing protein [Aurantiacibacter suaedae]
MKTGNTPYEALRKATEIAGSQTAFANICGVGQPAVWKWLQSAKRLPAEHVLKVEAATGVSRHDLRPDIYPPVSPRFLGVDRAASRVSFNRLDEMQAPAA